MPYILAAMAINEPNNGTFSGRVRAINVSVSGVVDLALELETMPSDKFTISADNQKFKIGRKWYGYSWRKRWHGNWCYDAFAMPTVEAAALLNDLRHRKGWICSGGVEPFYQQWHEGYFSDDWLRAQL